MSKSALSINCILSPQPPIVALYLQGVACAFKQDYEEARQTFTRLLQINLKEHIAARCEVLTKLVWISSLSNQEKHIAFYIDELRGVDSRVADMVERKLISNKMR